MGNRLNVCRVAKAARLPVRYLGKPQKLPVQRRNQRQ